MNKWTIRHSGFNEITIMDGNECIAEINWNHSEAEKNSELIAQAPDMFKLLSEAKVCIIHARQFIKNIKPEFADTGMYRLMCEKIDQLIWDEK